MSTPNLKLVPQDSTLDSLAQVADSIAIERENVEWEKIKRLAESGFRDEAWKLVVKHLQIKEPKLRRIK